MRSINPVLPAIKPILAAAVLGAGLLTAPGTAAAADTQTPVVEDFAYLNADAILAAHGVKLLKGDGRIRFVPDCTAAGLFRVESLVGSESKVACFEVLAPNGFVTMDIPNVYLVRGGTRQVRATATHGGETETQVVPPNTYVAIGGGNATHTLVELRATSTDPLPEGTPSAHPFTAKVDTAGRGCSGVLVAPQWLATSKRCFSATGDVPAGAPPQPATAIVGRADLERSGGQQRTIVELVPRDDRDLVLARLDNAVMEVAPIPLATSAPAAGEAVQAAGYGRTATEWTATRLRASAFTTTTVSSTTVETVRAAGTATSTCKGDAGGPVFRTVNGAAQLLALSSSSWQTGCAGVTDTQDTATAARVDDIAGWIGQKTRNCNANPTQPVSGGGTGRTGDYNGDGKTDFMAQYSTGAMRVWASTGDLSGPNQLGGQNAQVGTGWDGGNVPRIVTGDFTGDCKTDILAQYGSGLLRAWASTGDLSADNKLFSPAAGVDVGAGWDTNNVRRIITGDFTGDGKTDFMAQYANGTMRAWGSTGDLSAPNKLGGQNALVGSGFDTTNVPRIITGDFTGDGRTDLMGQYSSGLLRLWVSSGDLSGDNKLLTPAAGVDVGQGWDTNNVPRIVTGDFTGDGRTDFIAQYSDGRMRAWASTGDVSAPFRLGGQNALVGTGFGAAGVPRLMTGDYNGDGRTDLMGQYSSGLLRVWPSSGDLSADARLWSPAAGVDVGAGWQTSNVERIG